jgi:hypothetical protein
MSLGFRVWTFAPVAAASPEGITQSSCVNINTLQGFIFPLDFDVQGL